MVPFTARTRAGLPRHDIARSRIPGYALAVLEALRFGSAGSRRLASLSETEFDKALEFCDKAQLTLILGHVRGDVLPPWVRARLEQNLRDYSIRFERLKQSLFEIAAALEGRGVEFVVLKGLAHAPDFTPDALLRAQGDIDLWCEPGALEMARDALLELDYRPTGSSRGRHLPPMVREKQWDWRGDYFAPDLPIPVELHYQLWDEKAESLPIEGNGGFWERRTTAAFDGRRLPVLSKPDTLAFAALHLLMHLLHGDLRLQRAWEIAYFLDRNAHDDAFWSVWRASHSDSLRRLEAIVFQLVSDWFDTDLAETASEEVEALPADVKLWLERYTLSPLEVPYRANKDELWLQLALVESARDRRAIFFRRLLPLRPPPTMPAKGKHRTSFLKARIRHHSKALFPTLTEGLRWAWAAKGPAPGFLRFQAASVLLSLGVFVFLLLYNLHLLEIGMKENVMGRITAAMSLGSFAGAISAAALTRRAGIAKTILIAIFGSAGSMGLRAAGGGEAPLLATAFLHGVFLSFWAVSFSPAIAALTTERNRQFAFSLACSAAVCVGIFAGVLGGWLPGLLRPPMGGNGEATRMALYVSAGITALAAWPAARLRLAAEHRREAKVYPRGPFLVSLLACLGLWTVAVRAFNPFFNTFFAEQLRMSVERIGLVFSLSHAAQVLALLMAPLALRWLGQVRGIACMQFATGLALACLALHPGAAGATLAYVAYTSFQYMSEPGVLSMLMGRVAPGERSGASALFLLVTSIAGSVAAFAAGSAVVCFGYPFVLAASAVAAAGAALLFHALVRAPAGETS